MAASFASAPELQKKTCPSPAPACRIRSLMATAARVATGFEKKFDTCINSAACAAIAPLTAGLQCPRDTTAMPARKSR
jgi:hypothetical protein